MQQIWPVFPNSATLPQQVVFFLEKHGRTDLND